MANTLKDEFICELIDLKPTRKLVIGCGAADKGSTLLSYAGVRPDLVEFVLGCNSSKSSKCLPLSRSPIVDESAMRGNESDVVLVLPYNLKSANAEQLHAVKAWAGQFVVCVPEVDRWG